MYKFFRNSISGIVNGTINFIKNVFKFIYYVIIFGILILYIFSWISPFVNIIDFNTITRGDDYRPNIIDSKNIHQSIIYDVLSRTDKNIVKHIDNIYVVYGDRIDCKNSLEAIGCMKTKNYYNSGRFTSSIYVVDSGFWTRNTGNGFIECGTFEGTLQHEIGHVDGTIKNVDSEEYANNYAERHTTSIGKC